MKRNRPNIQAASIVAIAALVVIGGCDRCGDDPPPGGTDGAHQLAELIPSDAKAVAFSEDFRRLNESLTTVLDVVPPERGGIGEVNHWEEVGGWVDGPGAAFWVDGQLVVVGWVDDEQEDVDIDAWATKGERRAKNFESEGLVGWRQVDEEGQEKWLATDGRRIGVGWLFAEDAQPVAQRLWGLEKAHWRVSGYQKRLLPGDDEQGDVPPVYGAVDVSSLMGGLGGEERAADLLRQLRSQIGRVYWAGSDDEQEDSRRITLYTPGQAEVPVAVADLGEAKKPLPDLGGLVRPGTPGILRVSLDPDQLLELLRGSLEAGQRSHLDMSLEMLQGQLQVDLQEDLLGNLTGQAAVVVFGIEDAFFDYEGLELAAALARLETTREAVVIPIEDSEEVGRVLDAFTQLSRGALRRDAGERTIQYAWFDDGALEWALILSDEHLAYIDSMVARDRLTGWERSPSPLDEEFVDRDVDSMLQARRGLGMYLEVDTIRTMLDEGGAETRAEWLEGIDALSMKTDAGGTPEMAELRVWLSDRGGDEEE